MKIRNCYVSNSSSSSFIICQDLTEKGIACLKLTQAQKELLNGAKLIDGTIINLNLNKDFYLTEYISDCVEKKWEIVTSIEHLEYDNGQISEEPYEDSDYNEYQIDGDRSVYLRKEHDEAKQMKFSKFAKEFKKTYSDIDVIVQYKDDHIILKLVK